MLATVASKIWRSVERARLQSVEDSGNHVPVALVSPLDDGSAHVPTPRGSRLLILSDSHGDTKIEGTVGGGLFEKILIEEGLKQKQTTTREFDLRFTESEGVYACGGTVRFLIEPLDLASEWISWECFRLLSENGKSKIRTVEVLSVVEGCDFAKRIVIGEDGSRAGTLGDEALDREVVSRFEEFVSNGGPKCVALEDMNGKSVDVCVHVVNPRPTVFLFGGGHCGQAVTSIALTAGFEVVVADDREQFRSVERFPLARCRFPIEFVQDSSCGGGFRLDSIVFEGGSELNLTEQSFVCVMTQYDQAVVSAILRYMRAHPSVIVPYIGVIGSRGKAEKMFNQLRLDGFTGEELRRIHCPIGLQIPGDTAGEIAVSIVSELQMVRHGRDPLLGAASACKMFHT